MLLEFFNRTTPLDYTNLTNSDSSDEEPEVDLPSPQVRNINSHFVTHGKISLCGYNTMVSKCFALTVKMPRNS